MLRLFTCIAHEHDLLMVLFAGGICVLAAVTTFIVLQHARNGSGRRLGWIGLAAFVSGVGIWATHFIAMLAFRPGLEISFEPGATLLSVVVAISITGLGWRIALGENRWLSPLGGAVAGAGVGTMHYVGMSAMQFAGRIAWDEKTVLASLLIGVLLSAAATAEHRRGSTLIPWRSGLLFALAICALHFVAMSAAVLELDATLKVPVGVLDRSSLTVAVGALALVIFVISFGVVLFDNVNSFRKNLVVQQALDASETLNRGIIEASPDGLSVLELDGTVLFVNRATLGEYGLDDAAALVGQPWGSRFPRSARVRTDAALTRAQRGEVSRVLLQLGQGDQRWWDVMVAPVCDAAGTPIKIVAISRDVTDHKNAEDLAKWTANHDALTQLPNRLWFQKRLGETIEACTDSAGQFALLLLDIDDFKRVNDTIGHDAGDKLLCAFADKLRSAVRPEDFIARLGGDEFALILPGLRSTQAVASAVERLSQQLQEPFVYSGRILDCHASIGASLYPGHGNNGSDLLKSADVALYSAKSAGGSNLKIFRSAMAAEMQKRSSMLAVARDGLTDRRILPYYQPKIDLSTGALNGFEALLRWRHPTRGIQEPHTIAAAFEDPNLAAEIGDCMIARVIHDIQLWRNTNVDFRHVAVNASAAEFRRGDYAERLLSRMAKAGVPPACLQVEVTETVFLGRGAEYVEKALKLLSAAGVQIALDDFGTGYASLSHLKQFPVNIIKIDQTFVRELEHSGGDAAIVDAVINLGRSLNIRIVAEGVETTAQHTYLCKLGCDIGQGHLYHRAAQAQRVREMVEKFSTSTRKSRIAA